MNPYRLDAVLSIVAGILILTNPRLLNYVVAIYFLVTGVLHLVR